MKVKFTRIKEGAKVPSRGSTKAAGYDLYACIKPEFPDIMEDFAQVEIPPHKTVMIGTGLAIQPPEGYWGAIFARSGLATKQGLRPSNCVGMCDEDYTGEYIVALHNDSDETRWVQNGDRIAQLTFIPYISAEFEEVEALDKTDRGSGGFGSTGK